MTNISGKQDALELAKKTLESIDPDKYPKRYQTQNDLIKALELAENQKIRAEKAEKLARRGEGRLGDGTPIKPEGEQTPKKTIELSTDDLYAVMEHKVPREDIDDVKEYAALRGISVTEALKSSVVKTILSDNAEQRKIANATNIGGGKRGASKIPASALLRRAEEKNELPESDEDLDRLLEARLSRNKASGSSQ